MADENNFSDLVQRAKENALVFVYSNGSGNGQRLSAVGAESAICGLRETTFKGDES